jgi:hypothetical protein
MALASDFAISIKNDEANMARTLFTSAGNSPTRPNLSHEVMLYGRLGVSEIVTWFALRPCNGHDSGWRRGRCGLWLVQDFEDIGYGKCGITNK